MVNWTKCHINVFTQTITLCLDNDCGMVRMETQTCVKDIYWSHPRAPSHTHYAVPLQHLKLLVPHGSRWQFNGFIKQYLVKSMLVKFIVPIYLLQTLNNTYIRPLLLFITEYLYVRYFTLSIKTPLDSWHKSSSTLDDILNYYNTLIAP